MWWMWEIRENKGWAVSVTTCCKKGVKVWQTERKREEKNDTLGLNVVLGNKEAGPSKVPYILHANREAGHFLDSHHADIRSENLYWA